MNLYEADFSKIDSTGRLAMLFDAIPAQLNKNASRFQASSILNGESSDKVYSDKNVGGFWMLIVVVTEKIAK